MSTCMDQPSLAMWWVSRSSTCSCSARVNSAARMGSSLARSNSCRAAASISPAVSGISDGRVVNPDACPDGGESLRDFYRRVAGFAGDLAAAEVAIVAHGGTLRMLTACRQGVPVEEMTWDPLANATVLRSPSH